MVHPARIRHLNDKPTARGRFVVYWMQQSQRTLDNHALAYAIHCANELNQPLIVFFCLFQHYPQANARHFQFMLQGLAGVRQELEKRGVAFIVHKGEPDRAALAFCREASMIVTDRGYLKIQREWRLRVAEHSHCSMVQIESDVVVPIEEASDKEAYSAATLRPKILKRLGEFLEPVRLPTVKKESIQLKIETVALDDLDALLASMEIDRHVPPVEWVQGGTKESLKRLRLFIERDLAGFESNRNDPSIECRSNMSPYLHFGQISPVTIANAVLASGSKSAPKYLEELIVRRELAMNFCHFNHHYDSITALPSWAAATLEKHIDDKRATIYFPYELEHCKTHDPYWNAAQLELVKRGTMHGYMRMYWGKKILEWSKNPHAAFKVAVYLNNKYSLDGRDPCSYAGIAWCFGKHDRPWKERPIFGTVRYMNDKGLERKFDMDKYVERISAF